MRLFGDSVMPKPGAAYRSLVRLGARLAGPMGYAMGAAFVAAVVVAIVGIFGFIRGAMSATVALLSRRQP